MTQDKDSLYRSLGRIEGKQDLILNQMAMDRANHNKLEERHKALEVRVSHVERRFYTWGGVFTAVVFGLSFFGKKISEAIVGQ